MDLIPKPDQIVAASANVAQKVLYGGVADLRPMPRTLIDEGQLREVYHYRPAGKVKVEGDPVLLVTPLAAPSLCFDLRRGCSLVEHLVTQGRPTYLVEYGQVSFKDRSLGMEHWVREVVPEAIRAASRHAGGRPVHVVGWSLGGLFTLLTAAAWDDLPIQTVTAVGAPIDVRQVPLIAPVRPLLGVVPDRASIISLAYRAMGGVPQPIVRRAFQLSTFDKLVTKPFVQLAKLDDADFLAQLEAVDRFTRNMIAYPGRTFGQLYHRMIKGNELAQGKVHFEGRDVDFADIKVPVLAFGGAGDTIAPISCVEPITKIVPHATEMRFEVVPGGHLGMLTGRRARGTTWLIIDDFIDQHASDRDRQTQPRQVGAGPRAKRPARSRSSAGVSSTRTPAGVVGGGDDGDEATEPVLGANKKRRFTSASSCSLAGGRPRRDGG
jgi:polyhydroxyalkanoate synthase subunit PhaC